jgi:DNA-binding XRE family transcriptional regulator
LGTGIHGVALDSGASCSSINATVSTPGTKRVAARIAELRNKKAMSQETLAKKAGINRVTLARLERGLHPPKLDTLEAIARALNVALTDLVR